MFELKNGWTKKTMLEKIQKENNGPSLNSLGECVYRKFENELVVNKCFVGVFIPDYKYKPSFENVSVTDLGIYVPFPLSLTGMRELQTVHDSLKHATKEELHTLAENWINANTYEG